MLCNPSTKNKCCRLHLSCVIIMYVNSLENILWIPSLMSKCCVRAREKRRIATTAYIMCKCCGLLFQEYIMCTPYVFNKTCGTHLLRVNDLDCKSHDKMPLTPSLMNICSGFHLSRVNVVASNSRK